jgi:hypothetical protein
MAPGPRPFELLRATDRAESFWRALQSHSGNGIWKSPETLGWLYQYYLEPGLKIFRSPRAPKIKDADLAARTQQFTPRWISDFLVQNTLGRLWHDRHPDSRIAPSLGYLVPLPFDSPVPAFTRARDITILDPACGTMHLGLSALDLLMQIYREELAHAGKPGWPAEPSVADEADIPASILRYNLFGVDIDPLALQLAEIGFFLGLGGRLRHPPNLLCADSLQQTLSGQFQNHRFPDRFDVILLNPPYLDKRDYGVHLKSFMAQAYPQCGRNFYTAFLDRSVDLLAPGGRLGAVTPQTFMFIRSFEAARRSLLDRTVIETLVHTGLNTFDDAVVDCAFYVLRRRDDPAGREAGHGRFIQITTPNSPDRKQKALVKILRRLRGRPDRKTAHAYDYAPTDFAALPGGPWVYWISPSIRKLFRTLPALGDVAELRQGLATTDNGRFLRFVWEIPRGDVGWTCRSLAEAVESDKKWFPYMKGGGYRKWYGCREYLVNWDRDGREIKAEIARRYPYLKGNWQWVAKNTDFYFREGITYSYLTSGKFNARLSPAGSIFDVAGSSIFCPDLSLVLAILNSRFCRFTLGLINPTVNFQVGDLQRLPVPRQTCPPALRDLVTEAIDLARSLEAFEETSPDFIAPPPWPNGCDLVARKNERLMDIQNQVDRWVYDLYGLGQTDQRLIKRLTTPDEVAAELRPDELAYRWISYAMGVVFGRYASSASAAGTLLLPIVPSDEQGLAGRVRTALETLVGNQACRDIIKAVSPSGSLHAFLAPAFFKRHFVQFQRRPIYWFLQWQKQPYCLNYLGLDPARYRQMAKEWNLRPFDGTTGFHFDDGIQFNMKPFRRFLALNTWKQAVK